MENTIEKDQVVIPTGIVGKNTLIQVINSLNLTFWSSAPYEITLEEALSEMNGNRLTDEVIIEQVKDSYLVFNILNGEKSFMMFGMKLKNIQESTLSPEAQKLYQFVTETYRIRYHLFSFMRKSLTAQKSKGTYVHSTGLNHFSYLVDAACKIFAVQHGTDKVDWKPEFSIHIRQEVAKYLTQIFEDQDFEIVIGQEIPKIQSNVQLEFVNELENAITISINQSDNTEYDGIDLIIEGPTSTASNHITRMEAEKLLEALTEYLE